MLVRVLLVTLLCCTPLSFGWEGMFCNVLSIPATAELPNNNVLAVGPSECVSFSVSGVNGGEGINVHVVNEDGDMVGEARVVGNRLVPSLATVVAVPNGAAPTVLAPVCSDLRPPRDMVRVTVVFACAGDSAFELAASLIDEPDKASVLNSPAADAFGSVACGDIGPQSHNLTFYASSSRHPMRPFTDIHVDDYESLVGSQVLYVATCDDVVRIV